MKQTILLKFFWLFVFSTASSVLSNLGDIHVLPGDLAQEITQEAHSYTQSLTQKIKEQQLIENFLQANQVSPDDVVKKLKQNSWNNFDTLTDIIFYYNQFCIIAFEYAHCNQLREASIKALEQILIENLEWLFLEEQAFKQLGKFTGKDVLKKTVWSHYKEALQDALLVYLSLSMPQCPQGSQNQNVSKLAAYKSLQDYPPQKVSRVVTVTEVAAKPFCFNVKILSRQVGVIRSSKESIIECGPFTLEELLLLLYTKGSSLCAPLYYVSPDTAEILQGLIDKLEVWMQLAVFSL